VWGASDEPEASVEAAGGVTDIDMQTGAEASVYNLAPALVGSMSPADTDIHALVGLVTLDAFTGQQDHACSCDVARPCE
jgi:hypothetical protein